LQEERILSVSAEQQRDRCTRTNTSDAHDFPRQIDETVLRQQYSTLVLERQAVLAQKPLHVSSDAVAIFGVLVIIEPDDQRWLGEDVSLTIDLLRELGERVQAV
jgi:hypothetical protein